MKNSKGFIQIILVLVVVALVGGGMFYFRILKNKSNIVIETPTEEPVAQETQKPSTPTVKPIADPTANWKTFTNDFVGYSFKYPSTWSPIDLTQGQQVELYYQSDRTKPVGEILVENITSSNYESETQPGLPVYFKTLGNIEAKCKTDNMAKTWCFVKNSEKYISVLTTKVQNQDDYNKTLDQILSTFKFTK